jgi:hypothetical protein
LIKIVLDLDADGVTYLFGLTETNLNRMEFNKEPIFFDFGYANHPELFALVHYFPEYDRPESINLEAIAPFSLPFFDSDRGVTPKTLRFFPIARSIMQKFRATPFWGFETKVAIAHPGDSQLFFAGRDEKAIEKYFQDAGLIAPETKRSTKGFGKR